MAPSKVDQSDTLRRPQTRGVERFETRQRPTVMQSREPVRCWPRVPVLGRRSWFSSSRLPLECAPPCTQPIGLSDAPLGKGVGARWLGATLRLATAKVRVTAPLDSGDRETERERARRGPRRPAQGRKEPLCQPSLSVESGGVTGGDAAKAATRRSRSSSGKAELGVRAARMRSLSDSSNLASGAGRRANTSQGFRSFAAIMHLSANLSGSLSLQPGAAPSPADRGYLNAPR